MENRMGTEAVMQYADHNDLNKKGSKTIVHDNP